MAHAVNRYNWLILAAAIGLAILRIATATTRNRESRTFQWKGRVVLAVLALLLIAYGRYRRQIHAPEPPKNPARTVQMLTMVTKNGLLRVHYPDDFVAKPSENTAVTFFEPGPFATVAKGTLVSVRADREPISQDANEYARVLQQAREKGNLELHYQLGSVGPGTCTGGNPGVLAVWSVDGFHATACTFLKNRIGYSFMYMVANGAEARDEPIVKRIIDETELLDGSSGP